MREKHGNFLSVFFFAAVVVSLIFSSSPSEAWPKSVETKNQEKPAQEKRQPTPVDEAMSLLREKNLIQYEKSSGELSAEGKRIEAILDAYWNVKQGKIRAEDFWSTMGLKKVGRNDLIKAKSLLTYNLGLDLADQILGPKYAEGGTPVEEKICPIRREIYRSEIVPTALREVAMVRRPKGEVYIKDVGKGAKLSNRQLQVETDFDVNIISNDLDFARQCKKKIDNKVEIRLGMDPRAADTICTVHGEATAEEFPGEHGKTFAQEQFIFKKGTPIFRLEDDSFQLKEMDAEEAAKHLRAEIDLKKYLNDNKGVSVVQGVATTEPGVSITMARLSTNEFNLFKNGVYSPLPAIIKHAKEASRSNKSLTSFLNSLSDPAAQGLIGNRSMDESKLIALGDEITKAANMPASGLGDFTLEDLIIKRIADYCGGTLPVDVKLKAERGAIDKTIELASNEFTTKLCEKFINAMWSNAKIGYEAATKTIERSLEDARNASGDEEKQTKLDEARKRLDEVKDQIDTELKVTDPAVMPDDIRRLLTDDFPKFYAEKLEVIKSIGIAAFKNDIDFIEKMSETKQGRALAAARFMMKASEKLDSLNNILDYVDSKLLDKIRCGDFAKEALAKRGSLRKANPSTIASIKDGFYKYALGSIGTINNEMNSILQATATRRGALKAVQHINLAMELDAYVESYSKEGYEGLAMEFFRRRIPFFSASENLAAYNYYQALWEFSGDLFPPVGMVQAALSLGDVLLEKSKDYYWSTEMDYFLDTLYASAVFKLEGVTSYENAKLGKWSLYSVKYKNTEFKRDEIYRPMKTAVKTKGSHKKVTITEKPYCLVGWVEVREIIKKTLPSTLPNLAFAEELSQQKELMERPDVGEKLLSDFQTRYDLIWDKVEKQVADEIIARLEKRKTAEGALALGNLPVLQEELTKVVTALEIKEAAEKAMDAEGDYRLLAWLRDVKREIFSQEPIDITKTTQLVIKYLDTYKKALALRTQMVSETGIKKFYDSDLGFLTGTKMLSAKPSEDIKKIQALENSFAAFKKSVARELLDIKSQSIKDAALDSEFDQATYRAVLAHDIWFSAWSVYGESTGNGSERTKVQERGQFHAKKHEELVEAFRQHYAVSGALLVHLRQEADGQELSDVIKGARVFLYNVDKKEFPLIEKDNGNYEIAGLLPGKYQLVAQANGFRTPDNQKQAEIEINIGLTEKQKSLTVEKTVLMRALGLIEIRVINGEDQEPIAGALVKLSGVKLFEMPTDSAGYARFTYLPPGAYSADVVHQDYQAVSPIVIELGPQEDRLRQQKTIKLYKALSLKVNIRNEAHELIPGYLTLDKQGEVFAENGTYEWTAVKAGKHAVSCRADGFAKQEVVCEVIAGAPPLNIRLAKELKLKVNIRNENNELMAGTVSLDNGQEVFTPTGSHEFSGMKPGEHKIVCSAQGYVKTQAAYTATADLPVHVLNVAMKKGRSITISVSDESSGRGVSGAAVVVGAARDSTDGKGLASLFLQQEGEADIVMVSHPSYVPKTVSLPKESSMVNVRLVLKEKPKEEPKEPTVEPPQEKPLSTAMTSRREGGWVISEQRADIGPSGDPADQSIARPVIFQVRHTDQGFGFGKLVWDPQKYRELKIEARVYPAQTFKIYFYKVAVDILGPNGQMVRSNYDYLGRGEEGDYLGVFTSFSVGLMQPAFGTYNIAAVKGLASGGRTPILSIPVQIIDGRQMTSAPAEEPKAEKKPISSAQPSKYLPISFPADIPDIHKYNISAPHYQAYNDQEVRNDETGLSYRSATVELYAHLKSDAKPPLPAYKDIGLTVSVITTGVPDKYITFMKNSYKIDPSNYRNQGIVYFRQGNVFVTVSANPPSLLPQLEQQMRQMVGF